MAASPRFRCASPMGCCLVSARRCACAFVCPRLREGMHAGSRLVEEAMDATITSEACVSRKGPELLLTCRPYDPLSRAPLHHDTRAGDSRGGYASLTGLYAEGWRARGCALVRGLWHVKESCVAGKARRGARCQERDPCAIAHTCKHRAHSVRRSQDGRSQ